LEIEIKASALPAEPLDPEQVFARAKAVLPLLGQPRSLRLRAEYHDSEDGTLRSQRVTLRARQEGERLLAALKAPSAGGEAAASCRMETEIALESWPEVGDALPAGIAEAARAAGIELRRWPGARFHTEVERALAEVRMPGHGIAEIAVDHGRVFTDEREDPVRELEIELIQGDSGELALSAWMLGRRLGVRPGGRSKAARGMRLLGALKAPKPGESLPRLDAHPAQLWTVALQLEEWIREGESALAPDWALLLRELGQRTQHPLLRAVDASATARLEEPELVHALWDALLMACLS
jgi:inorganic triphosphatase YgiF